jgi:hypothetical protein
MSSLIIEKNDYPAAKGSWVQVGAGQSEYSFSWGFISTDSSTSTSEQQETLMKQMEKGLEFGGVAANAAI